MKNYKTFVGIDISRSKLDVSFINDLSQKEHDHLVVANDRKGLPQLLSAIRRRRPERAETLVCFENTGIYGMPLAMFLQGKGVDYCMVPALAVKRSKGISRGKSDKVDARDIASYAVSHLHKLCLYELPEADILKLRLIENQREKLTRAIHSLSMTDEDYAFLPKEITREVRSINTSSVKKLKEALAQIEERAMRIIESNEKMKGQYALATSVPGVGRQVATYLIIATRCFTAFADWRKMACYAGVAPFEYTSGSSVRGRTKVSEMANKKIKSLLHLSALTAKRCDGEMAGYYKRKLAEGKNPMSVLNAVRCKVLSRVFAAVQRGKPFVNVQKFAA